MLFAIVAWHDYEIWQIGIETIFLNRNLTEDVCRLQLDDFVDLKHGLQAILVHMQTKQHLRAGIFIFDETFLKVWLLTLNVKEG